MDKKIIYIFTFFGLLISVSLSSLEAQPKIQNTEKIRGSRFIPYPNYSGSPFLNDKFLIGEVEFADGAKIGNIGLNYGSYRDELIYYNTTISAQIVIDKISLKGFSFTDKNGNERIFRRQYFNGYFQGDCYFEVLSEGNISLLVYRKVNLEACDTYYSKTGMAYQPSYSYYMYSAGKGYSPLNLNRNSLLSKFGKPTQKQVKKILRKNGILIVDEASFIMAWNLIKENGIDPNF